MPTVDENVKILKEVMEKFGLTLKDSDNSLLTKISEKAEHDNIDLESLTLKQLKGVMNDIKENGLIKPEPIQVENLAHDIYQAHIYPNPQAKPVESEFPQVEPKFYPSREKNIEILKDAMETFNLKETEFPTLEGFILKEISDKASEERIDLEALNLKQLNGFMEEMKKTRNDYDKGPFIQNTANYLYKNYINPQPEPTVEYKQHENSNTAVFKDQFHGVLSKAESKNENKEISVALQPNASSDDLFEFLKKNYEKYRENNLPDLKAGEYPKEVTLGEKKCLEFHFKNSEDAVNFFVSMAKQSGRSFNIVDPETHQVIANIDKDGKITQNGPNGKPMDLGSKDLSDLLDRKCSAPNKKAPTDTDTLSQHKNLQQEPMQEQEQEQEQEQRSHRFR